MKQVRANQNLHPFFQVLCSKDQVNGGIFGGLYIVTRTDAATRQQCRVSSQQFLPDAQPQGDLHATWIDNSFTQMAGLGWSTYRSDLLQSLAQWRVQQQ